MLAPLKLFATKLAIFSTVLLYLALDLWVFQGPVWSFVHKDATEEDTTDKPLARLYGEPIRQSDWDATAAQMAFARGLEQMPESAYATVLMETLREQLLRIRVIYNDNNVPVMTDAARTEMQAMVSRAPSAKVWQDYIAAHGLSEQGLLSQIAATLRQQYLLERSTAQVEQVSDQQVADYYELTKEQLRIPASRHVRHLFLRQLNQDETALKQRAESLLQRAREGEPLSALARAHSQDKPSAERGGDLGIIHEGVRIALPELDLFGERAIPAQTVMLKKSRWGWHLIEAGPITPSRLPSLAECAPSLRSALESARRAWAVDEYFQTSFKSLFADQNIHIYER